MRICVTRRPNGLYLITRYPPLRVSIHGTMEDTYIVPGDPIGVNHLCPAMVHILCRQLDPFDYIHGRLSFEPDTEPVRLESQGELSSSEQCGWHLSGAKG